MTMNKRTCMIAALAIVATPLIFVAPAASTSQQDRPNIIMG